MDSAERRNLLTGFHIIVTSIYTTSFTLALWSFISAIFNAFITPIAIPTWFLLIICAAAIGTELVITFYFSTPDTGKFLRLRVFIVTGFLSYILGAFFIPGPLLTFHRFLPGLETLTPPLFSFFVFWFMASKHNHLLFREELLQDMEGKRGEALLHILQQDHPRILAGLSSVVSFNRGSVGGFILLTLMTMILWLAEVPLTIGFQLPAIIAGLFALSSLALGNTYLDDHRTIQRTSLASNEQRITRVIIAFVLIVLSFFLTFFLARNASLLPLAILESLFIWLVQLFTTDTTGRSAIEVQQLLSNTTEMPRWGQLPLEDVVTQPSEFSKIFFEVLLNALKIGVVVGVIFFLVYPAIQHGGFTHLLRTLKHFFSRSWLGSIWRTMGRLFHGFWNLLISIIKFRHRSWVKKPGLSSEEYLQGYLQQVKHAKAQQGKRSKSLHKTLELFRQYLDIAIQAGVVLTKQMTLRDISKALPLKYQQAGLAIAALLEQCLYSPEEISAAVYEELSRKISDLDHTFKQDQAAEAPE